MTKTKNILPPPRLPDHTQLPDSDGNFVKNFQEHPQSILLTNSLGSVLKEIHPEGDYIIGQDSGIYWRITDPPVLSAEAPDWFYVPHVPSLLDGKIRRFYVFWQELKYPLIAIEFASGNGKEKRSATPLFLSEEGERTKPGKFLVYENILRIAYYSIYEIRTGKLEVYYLKNDTYQKLVPNERGHYSILPLKIELGLWQGTYQNQTQLWLRWWDELGNLLLIEEERAELEKYRTGLEKQRSERAERRAHLLEENLKNMGVEELK
ncbi:MAG: Uma2 family endonuclease [Prochloron sp. SP5CPC1]|nr:Uma2 family endonuclease [Candidatus Paraprochloron terpiosi SP5CPC1]